ncbi:probable cytochrome P450 28d1 [Stomoxys calcitrans]|uniref:probable cytochrome P450 28d1 n=1 Tax=Stomoxys calcitrans TaxID=35570 RepID=UPI0027E30805|nr:probable cytochrome P450 28d1 [Stomoxys calcitrans]
MYYIFLSSFLIGIGCAYGLYKYLTWHFDYWVKKRIPGPKPKVLFGTFPGTVNGSRNFIYDLDEVYNKFSKKARFIGVFNTRNPQIFILDPILCKDILISNFTCFQDNESSKWMDRAREPISGSNPFVLPFVDWKVKRSEFVPGLTSSKVKSMMPIITSIGDKLVAHLKEKVKNGKCTIDAKEVALYYTGEVVADVVWGVQAGNFEMLEREGTIQESPFLSMSKRMIGQTFKAFKYFFILGIFPFVKYLIYVRFFPEVTDRFFLKLTHSTLQNRRALLKVPRSDFLQHLVELQMKKGLNLTEVLAHMLTFHFDGFETSATLISHCLLLLARCLEKQDRLRAEINEYMLTHNDVVEFSDLMKLPYLEQCIAETLRIFAPLPFMAKVCTNPCILENNDGVNLEVQPGEVCLISIHSMHHDEQYFPQPEEFIPERFADENGGVKKYRDMGVYMPFGDGPRICLGMTFGLAQAKAAIAVLVKHFQLTVNGKTRKDNYQSPGGFITGLEGGIFIDFEEL